MSSLYEGIADLSLEERELFELLLRQEGVDVCRLPIPRRGEFDALPLSFAQERFWFLNQLEPSSPAYNVSVALRLKGLLNVVALEQGLNGVIRRHEALRTTLSIAGEQPVQSIAPYQPFVLSLIDLSGLPQIRRESEADRLAIEEARRPFDLTRGPLLRVMLLRLGEEDHVLLLITHHFVTDGWSMITLMRELATLYDAFSTGSPSPFPELPIQYADFALWQRQQLQSAALEPHLAYWKKQLAGASFILELPTDRPRPAVQSYRGATQSFALPVTLSEAIRSLSRREGTTLYMTLLAAFQTLLYRYTSQVDIIVGTAVSDRNRAETEGVIGPFSNSLLMRTDFSGNPSFRKLLGRAREMVMESFAHQDLPFEKLLEELNTERDLSRNPLFQVMFVLHQSTLENSLKLPGLTLSSLPVEMGSARFDLSLDMADGESALSGCLEYNTDIFSADTITRMLGHFQTLLEGIVTDPGARISDLPLMSADERRQLLMEWNETRAEYAHDQCVHQLFEAQVERTPEAVVVVFEGEQVTYGELNCRANQLAHYLQKRGVGPEVLVGICVERSVEMIVGLLGILKAGGAYVPLDPAYPQERLSFMLEDAKVKILLTQERLRSNLPAHEVQLVLLDKDWHEIAKQSPQNPVSKVSGANLAYVIYTSGSTGKPKGVGIEHHSTTTLIYWAREHFSEEQLAGVLASTSICFDLSVFELFMTLSWGGKVVLAENALQLPALAAAQEVTLINTVPSAITELLRAGSVPSSVTTVCLAGEPLQNALLQQIYQLAHVQKVYNLYGPTEDTTYSTWALLERGATGATPIGRPIANTQVYILDAHRQAVPVGVTGELHLGGDGLARGYLNRPELTAERFIAHPFSNEPTARLYKTGDLARYRADGVIEYLGRIDHQVKVRGFRIELGEIESVLSKHRAVQETVVVAREDVPGDQRLVAYVVLDQEHARAGGGLRQYLKEKLPEYMVPSQFVLLEALPLTPNGKVDRRALPAPDQVRPEVEKAFVPPRDALELQLAKIWQEVLGIESISVQDNFFDLGGHSLLAVRLFERIKKVFTRNLSLAILFQAPTVEQLAEILRKEEKPTSRTSLVALQPGGSKPPFFCVHAAGGNVLFYRDLARHLGTNQPFYGLQAQGLDGTQPRHTRIEEMASHYVREIRSLQPEGPYYLGGASFGGLIVFEMAQQLYAEGQEVALLALFDTYGPGYPRLLPETSRWRFRLGEMIKRTAHHVGSLRMLETEEKLAYFIAKAKKVLRLTRRSVKRKRKKIKEQLRQAVGQALPEPLVKVEEATHQAVYKYEPKVYAGRVTLFRASEQPSGIYPDPTLGWRELAGGRLEIHEVPGYHGAIVSEPRVRILAERLKACLDKI